LPRNPERTAWTVLIGAFLIFVTLVVSAVVGTRWLLFNARVGQVVWNDPSGTVQVTRPGRAAPEVNLQQIPIQSVIATEVDSQASLTFKSADNRYELATIQVFGDTQVKIEAADSPRFTTGTEPHRIVLNVTNGRVRVYVGVQTDREVRIEVHSAPTALAVVTEPGSNVSVEATVTSSMVTVREGHAEVSANDGAIVLEKDQRAAVGAEGQLSDPLPAEQNLIRNGDFIDPLDSGWALDVRTPYVSGEEPGRVERQTIGGRWTLRFVRNGGNWGQAGVVQTLNRDVRAYDTVRLHLDLLLVNQDLRNCGAQGTECPIMVKITYVDVYGNSQEWLHGFFYHYDANTATFGPTVCGTCAPVQWPHEQWPHGKWQVYDSPNLLEIFAANGIPAATLRSVSIYGSGHSFAAYVADVQLLASE
jgi:hypothetical protein